MTDFVTPRPLSGSLRRVLLGGCLLAALAACDEPLDLDLRSTGGNNTLDTSDAVTNLPNRPRPDNRGVISYPNYQVVVAQRGDTARTIGTRLGIDGVALAQYNGINPDATLRRDEVLALPGRVTEPSAATGAATSGPITPSAVDVTTLASNAIDRAGPQVTTPTASATATVAAPQAGTEPIRHQVKRGETAFSISRLYNVPVRNIADWNGLGPDLAIREGQFLLIPTAGASAPPRSVAVEPPGVGTVTPTPPSAAAPLPAENPTAPAPAAATPAAPNIGTQTPARSNAPLILPVQGSIIREYARGRSDGIDIGAPAGTAVKAAAAGTVGAVTKDTNGIGIVVLRHANNLLTVYQFVDGVTVAQGATVTQGQTIGTVANSTPPRLHFQVRQGTDSVDPKGFLP